jgi:hypothetical protein
MYILAEAVLANDMVEVGGNLGLFDMVLLPEIRKAGPPYPKRSGRYTVLD